MPKLPVLFLAGALASAPVAAVDVRFTDAEEALCEAEGGCMVVTRLILAKTQAGAFEQGKAAGLATCKGTV